MYGDVTKQKDLCTIVQNACCVLTNRLDISSPNVSPDTREMLHKQGELCPPVRRPLWCFTQWAVLSHPRAQPALRSQCTKQVLHGCAKACGVFQPTSGT